MNQTNRLAGTIGFVSCTALLGVLTGCTTYVDQPHARGGYYEEQPRPREVYAPPPVYAPAPAAYVPPPAVQVEVSAGFAIRADSDFYEPLAPYGRWQVVGSYGRCWIPGRVEVNWQPYRNGYWQSTEAGWYWASDEPWGWATYHYGRWDLSAQFGWYWVPQIQWAPAWVSWREGGGYVGWAPLQPSARIGAGGFLDVQVGVPVPRAFVFVEQRRFLEPVRPTSVVVNNNTVINKTVNITKIKVVNNTVINEGPRTTVIEQVSGRKVQELPVRELRHKQEAEVVARYRKGRSASEKNEKISTAPVRSEAQPREPKAAPLREQRQVEKPTATPTPAASRSGRAIEEQNRAATAAQEEANRVQREKQRANENRRSTAAPATAAKPEVERRQAIEAAADQNAEKQNQRQADRQNKHAEEVRRGAQRQLEMKAKHEQAAREQSRKNAAKKDKKKKGDESLQNPDGTEASPPSR